MVAIALFCQIRPDYYQIYPSREATRDQRDCIKKMVACVKRDKNSEVFEGAYVKAYEKCVLEDK